MLLANSNASVQLLSARRLVEAFLCVEQSVVGCTIGVCVCMCVCGVRCYHSCVNQDFKHNPGTVHDRGEGDLRWSWRWEFDLIPVWRMQWKQGVRTGG